MGLLFFILLYYTVSAQEDTNKNFSFEIQPDQQNFWKYRMNKGFIKCDRSCSSVVDGTNSWCLTSFEDWFHINIYNYIYIPAKGKKIELSIYSKSTSIANAWLKLYCLDDDENIIRRDSVSIIGSSNWKQFTIHSTTSGINRLYIEIEARSTNDPMKEKKLLIDNMRLLINGSEYHTISKTADKVNANPVTTVFDMKVADSTIIKSIPLIYDIQKPRIIALGESVHGSDNIQCCAFETIKHLIKNENCRLVLLEVNFELGMWLDEYVLGLTSEENIKKRLFGTGYNYYRLIDLLNWIREYNKSIVNKVSFIGFDTVDVFSAILGFDHLFDLLKNQDIEHDSLKSFYEGFQKHDFELVKNYIRTSSYFNKLEAHKREFFIHALELRQGKFYPNPSLMEGDREYIQFVNTQFAINLLLKSSEKAVIYSHLVHSNKVSNNLARIYIPNLGSYLNRHYKEDYFVIALLVGSGTISLGYSSERSSLPLELPVSGSIEKLCEDQNCLFLFKKTSELKSTYCGRYLGAFYFKDQYFTQNPKTRFDAVIFLKYSNGLTFPDDWPRTKEETKYYIDNQRALNGRDKGS